MGLQISVELFKGLCIIAAILVFVIIADAKGWLKKIGELEDEEDD